MDVFVVVVTRTQTVSLLVGCVGECASADSVGLGAFISGSPFKYFSRGSIISLIPGIQT